MFLLLLAAFSAAFIASTIAILTDRKRPKNSKGDGGKILKIRNSNTLSKVTSQKSMVPSQQTNLYSEQMKSICNLDRNGPIQQLCICHDTSLPSVALLHNLVTRLKRNRISQPVICQSLYDQPNVTPALKAPLLKTLNIVIASADCPPFLPQNLELISILGASSAHIFPIQRALVNRGAVEVLPAHIYPLDESDGAPCLRSYCHLLQNILLLNRVEEFDVHDVYDEIICSKIDTTSSSITNDNMPLFSGK
jgi:hypothetical protein